MKKIILSAAILTLSAGSLFAQEMFTGIGTKGHYNKTIKGATAFAIPQLSVGFETYVETKEVVQEGKLSKLQNVFEAHSKGGQYAGQQSGSAQVTTILNAGMTLEDYQALTNDFQKILEREIANAGFKVVPVEELMQQDAFQKVKDRFEGKTDKKKGKVDESDIGNAKVQMLPEQGIFMFNEKSFAVGGVPLAVAIKNYYKASDAILMTQNIDVDFSTVELDVDLDAGRRGKTTSAEMKVVPKMRITYNTFDFISKNGSPSSTPARLNADFISDKEYSAVISKDKAKAESLMSKLFSLKAKPDVNFDPRIIEMSKEDYIAASKDLFTQYSKEFAKALVVGAKGK
ncbi:hypothetical protein [Belliella pelovolcani]|uniref:hypothetical protein n=1 Tax=Belliella pelovolcani TaxID=529505 RepID=UPI00391D608B